MMTGHTRKETFWLILVVASLTTARASASPLISFMDRQQQDVVAPLTSLSEQLEQSISDREVDGDEESSEIPTEEVKEEEEAEAEQESESEAKMDLDAFLSQFVLIKTPYGYILARAPQQEGMSRARRGRHTAESNFQLRVRKSDSRAADSNSSNRLLNWMEMYRDRKATGTPFKAQHNFQLRVRKNTGAAASQAQQGIAGAGEPTGVYQGMRVRKALLQEIRDRRRSVADHSNNNFQLRVRKSPEQRTFGVRSAGPGQNFQLRVRRSVDGLSTQA